MQQLNVGWQEVGGDLYIPNGMLFSYLFYYGSMCAGFYIHHGSYVLAYCLDKLMIDWLIGWCLTSSEQFYSYIQDENI